MKFIYSLALLVVMGCASKPKPIIGSQTICDNNSICIVQPYDLTAWHRIKPSSVLPIWEKRAPKMNESTYNGGASFCPKPYFVQWDFTGYSNGTGNWTSHCYLRKDISHPLDGRESWLSIPGTEHPVGEAKHVTPAQWEAAQGLYNPHLGQPLCLQFGSDGFLIQTPCGDAK
jgi:hypothetical protein